MIELILLVFRALQFLFALIVLGLTGHRKSHRPRQTISLYQRNADYHSSPFLVASYDYSPSQVNFMVFVAVWTMLALIYLGLAPRFFSSFAHVHAILALDALTMLFWFAGFIALAVLYHDIVNVANFEFFAGCGALGDYCGVSEAAVVFGAFEWYVRGPTGVLLLRSLDGFIL